MNRNPIDIIQVRQEIKSGILRAYTENGHIYLADAKSGEAVIIGNATKEEK